MQKSAVPRCAILSVGSTGVTSSEAPQIHIAPGRRGRVAGRGARAAIPKSAPSWRPSARYAYVFRATDAGIRGGPAGPWVCRGNNHSHRMEMGTGSGRSTARSGRRARGITGRCDRHRGDASHQGGQERHAHDTIVMAMIGDPVGAGLVESLGRPGGNASGLSIVATDLSGRRLQLLNEIVPGLSSVAVMSYGANPQSQIEVRETQIAARRLDLRLYSVPISADTSIENAFEKIKKEPVQALIVVTDPILYSQRSQILDLAAGSRLPAMYPYRAFAEAGGLISYAPNDRDVFRRAASYVDRILKGANPGDLPVEQPTKFELVINLKTAKARGLEVPEHLQQLADEVIE